MSFDLVQIQQQRLQHCWLSGGRHWQRGHGGVRFARRAGRPPPARHPPTGCNSTQSCVPAAATMAGELLQIVKHAQGEDEWPERLEQAANCSTASTRSSARPLSNTRHGERACASLAVLLFESRPRSFEPPPPSPPASRFDPHTPLLPLPPTRTLPSTAVAIPRCMPRRHWAGRPCCGCCSTAGAQWTCGTAKEPRPWPLWPSRRRSCLQKMCRL